MIDWRDCIVHIPVRTYAAPVPNTAPRTLCEVCANACGRCSWSEHDVQQPVPGWQAIRNDILSASENGRCKKQLESYIVLDCPQFILEKRWSMYYKQFIRTRDRLHRIAREAGR